MSASEGVTAAIAALDTAMANLATVTAPGESPLAMAERIYRFRRLRTRYLSADLFHEPAWDILLDLFINAEKGRPVSVSNACIAAATSQTTGIRSLQALEREGLIERIDDQHDHRRVYVQLTKSGRGKMIATLTGTPVAEH